MRDARASCAELHRFLALFARSGSLCDEAWLERALFELFLVFELLMLLNPSVSLLKLLESHIVESVLGVSKANALRSPMVLETSLKRGFPSFLLLRFCEDRLLGCVIFLLDISVKAVMCSGSRAHHGLGQVKHVLHVVVACDILVVAVILVLLLLGQ